MTAVRPMAGVASGDGPQLTWSTVIAAIGVLAVIAGGAYQIVETQFTDQAKQTDLIRRELEQVREQYLTLREHIAYQQEQKTVNESVGARLTFLEVGHRDLLAHGARTPVEAKEVDGLSASVDKRIDLLQQQLNDINRQIAASVLQGFTNPTNSN
jgi:hypothetical protein